MTVKMTSLKRAANGDWYARKGIPKDVRESYKRAFGVAHEEIFRRPAVSSLGAAKAELRDWDAKVTEQIEALRAAGRGEGRDLTHRQVHGLAGRWYEWFVAQREEDPGKPMDWALALEELDDSPGPGAPLSWLSDDAPMTARRRARAAVERIGDTASFFGQVGIILSEQSRAAFLDAAAPDLWAAILLLQRRAGGDYKADRRPERFPDLKLSAPGKAAGLTCWTLFEAWVAERKPGPATVDRWRSVLMALNEHFEDRDIASITEAEARTWKDTLVTEKRSAQVANDTWLRAARVTFGWALDNRRIPANPFDGIAIATPKSAPKLREREFTDEEWATILKASLAAAAEGRTAVHTVAARRWVPWVCAYTGARAGEITQLRGQDVQQHRKGFWTIRITPEAGTVKGGQARVVPLHAHLIEMGFITFAQERGPGPLFYNPEGARVMRTDATNPGQAPWVKSRNKLAEWVRGLGVTDQNISPTHAWRHTFKRRAARAKIERRIRFGMCGHSSSDVGDEYETPTVEDLAKAMQAFPRYKLKA